LFRLVARAAQLELVRDEPPRRILRIEADRATGAFATILPLHERAVFVRALAAGKDASEEDSCAAFQLLVTKSSALRADARDILLGAGLSPESVEKPDPTQELSELRDACDAKDVDACRRLGQSYDNAEPASPDNHQRALLLYRQACDGGDLDACADLGADLLQGADPQVGLALLQRACTAPAAAGCPALGGLYARGRLVPQDAQKAADLYRRACDGGRLAGCRNLGVSYFQGAGVQLDMRKAADLFRDVCDTGDALSCANLARSYEQGMGVDKDERIAASLYRKACAAGDRDSCDRVR
jgi:TPR repeat protein